MAISVHRVSYAYLKSSNAKSPNNNNNNNKSGFGNSTLNQVSFTGLGSFMQKAAKFFNAIADWFHNNGTVGRRNLGVHTNQ